MYTFQIFLLIHEKLIQKMWCIENIICIFTNILQKNSSQKSFLWETENDHKKDCSPWVLCHCWLIWLWSHQKGLIIPPIALKPCCLVKSLLELFNVNNLEMFLIESIFLLYQMFEECVLPLCLELVLHELVV